MGIRNDQDAQIIRNAVALECSKAGHCFLMYRGTKNIKNDKPYCRDNPDIPFSICSSGPVPRGSI